jgi:hypothetical protein
VEYATQQVVQLSDLVTRSGTALHAIDTVIQEIIGEIAMVHRTAEEQARATAAVSGTMNAIAGITGATWESAENMRASMDQLAELAAILQAKIEMFRLNERLHGGPASSSTSLPLYSSGVSSGLTPGRITSTPASSFPAVPFPAASYPGTTPPAMSYPANPFAGAPTADPFATSSPKASATPATNGTAGDDMSLEATVPMPAIQPSPIFPTGSGPLTPMRISPLDDEADGSSPQPSGAQPEPAVQGAPGTQGAQGVQNAQGEAPEETPAEAAATTDQTAPDESHDVAQRETPEIASAARMEQPAPESTSTSEAAPETTPLRVIETKPLPALEPTGQVATAALPDALPDDVDYAMPAPASEPGESSDDESVDSPGADPA